MPDDLNLSDACLLALHDAGWIGPLRRAGDTTAPPPPPGVEFYRRANGGMHVRGVVWMPGQRRIFVAYSPATADGIAAVVRAVQAAREARDAGGDDVAVKAAAREEQRRVAA